MDTLNRSKDLNKGVDSSNDQEHQSALDNRLGSGAEAPEVVLDSLTEIRSDWIELNLWLLANAGSWSKDEALGCETGDNGEWEESDVVLLVRCGDGWDVVKVLDEGDWEVGNIGGVGNNAVDAGGEEGSQGLDGEVRDNVLVVDNLVGEGRGSVLWREVAQEAEWDVGGQRVDREREKSGRSADIVEAVEEQEEWAVGKERQRGNVVGVVFAVPSERELEPVSN